MDKIRWGRWSLYAMLGLGIVMRPGNESAYVIMGVLVGYLIALTHEVGAVARREVMGE